MFNLFRKKAVEVSKEASKDIAPEIQALADYMIANIDQVEYEYTFTLEWGYSAKVVIGDKTTGFVRKNSPTRLESFILGQEGIILSKDECLLITSTLNQIKELKKQAKDVSGRNELKELLEDKL